MDPGLDTPDHELSTGTPADNFPDEQRATILWFWWRCKVHGLCSRVFDSYRMYKPTSNCI